MARFKILLSFLGTFLFLIANISAQNVDERIIAELEEIIEIELKTSRAPGAIVSFVKNDSIVYQKPFGFSNKRAKELVTPETLFLTASLTKTFTTVVLLSICEEKGIDTSVEIGSILKSLSPILARTTIHELLSMSSGIIDFLPSKKKHKENAQLYFEHYGDKLVSENLKDVYSYTNIGHVLAGELIVALSGESFLEQMQKRLLVPLKMGSTTFIETEAMVKGYSLAYEKGSKVSHKLTYPFIRPAASMFSNVRDLSRFATCFMNNGKFNERQVIPENVIRKMETSFTPIGVLHEYLGYPESAYNYGLISFQLYGINFLGHPGETGSQNTIFVMAPEFKSSFILMSNTGAYPFVNAFEKMVTTFLTVQSTDKKELEVLDFNNYVGKYYRPNIEGNKLNQITITLQNKQLYINLGEEVNYHLKPTGKDRFTYKSQEIKWPMELKFYKNENGEFDYVNHAWRTFIKIK